MTLSATELSSLTDWRRGLISPKILIDEEIYNLELEKLFGRAWLFLAPDGQIPNPGDFFSTFMGADPVLVVRQRDGSVKALLNACRHRGMKVCRADLGTIRAFTCTYHGWSYDIDGRLVNVPNYEDGYYSELDTGQWGLIEVPLVESYKGLIFANFDPAAPPLIDYLGDMAWYLDALVDRRDGGIEVIGSVHKIRLKGNWKLAAEQFASDNYHFGVTHSSANLTWSNDPSIDIQRSPRVVEEGRQFSSRLGHGLAGFQIRYQPGQYRSLGNSPLAEYYERIMPEIEERLGHTRQINSAGTVFPNFSFLIGLGSIGVWHPKGPNEFEAYRWTIVDKAASAEEKFSQTRTPQITVLGGIVDSDDGENWSELGRNLSSPQVQRMLLNYQMGLGHERSDDVYPGQISDRSVAEAAARGFYRRWLEFMTAGDRWPSVDANEQVVGAQRA